MKTSEALLKRFSMDPIKLNTYSNIANAFISTILNEHFKAQEQFNTVNVKLLQLNSVCITYKDPNEPDLLIKQCESYIRSGKRRPFERFHKDFED